MLLQYFINNLAFYIIIRVIFGMHGTGLISILTTVSMPIFIIFFSYFFGKKLGLPYYAVAGIAFFAGFLLVNIDGQIMPLYINYPDQYINAADMIRTLVSILPNVCLMSAVDNIIFGPVIESRYYN